MTYKKKVRWCANKRTFSLLLPLLVTSLMAQSDKSIDATMISLEELVNTKFIPASTIANQISNASSAVSIVTSKEIKEYGYRTLGEILASMRGLHVLPYFSYTMLGGRGFPNRDYAGRIILYIDGYQTNDSMFGQAYLGNDGILDVALIDRVEYIPGGGSTGYGDGAIIGVINVITKKGNDIGGTQVALGFGSQHARQQRISVGEKLDNGANVLLSASSFGVNGTIEKDGDNDEKNKRFFTKYDSQNFYFVGAYAKRNIYQPTFDPSDSLFYGDENAFILLNYHTDIASNLKLSTSFWQGHYIFSTDNLIPLVSHYDTENIARWHGGDVKLIGTWFDKHTISLGAGYRNDYDWRAKDTYLDMTTNEVTNSEYPYQPRKTYNLYAYDDFVILPSLSLNYGLRYENSDNGLSYVSPRASVIWKPLDTTVLKLSAGKSNRQATPSEGDNYTKPEQTKTVEFALEQQLDSHTKLVSSVYQYRMSDRINTSYTPNIVVRGAEIELYKHWDEGLLLRTSYAKQNAETTDHLHLGSPSQIAKLNVSAPMFNQQLRIGTEVQYIDKFPIHAGANEYIGSCTIVNLNLLAKKIAPHLDVNFLVHDMFNKSDKEIVTFLPQSGRTFWLQLEYTFK